MSGQRQELLAAPASPTVSHKHSLVGAGLSSAISATGGLPASIAHGKPGRATSAAGAWLSRLVTDGTFRALLTLCAGTGVAAMGTARTGVIWHLQRITRPASLGYTAGVASHIVLHALS